ncbi:MAG: efflux RND transporter periplasmic adaptor subunit, partial [Planctomycetes bacterium]|nr:efflux RND transporter periplasmic adaptor subunit [Planctomycetota bacterium]
AKVEAPIAGRVGRTVAAGNLVSPAGPAVTTLIAVDPVYVTFDLDERTWTAARALLTAKDAPHLQVALDGEAGYPHRAALAFADNRVDPATGTMRLRARLDNTDGTFIPGSYVRVRLPVTVEQPRLLIDERAIASDQTNKYVYVAEAKPADAATNAPAVTIAAYRPIVLGPAVGDGLRIVAEGLKAGERVILDRAKIFFPGMPVAPIDAATPPAEQPGAGPAPAPASDAP